MIKAQVVTEISNKTGIEKAAVVAVVEEFMNVVKASLTSGENVYLRGFGTFEIIERAEKTGRNITAGTTLIVPAHKIPKFKPAKEFKESVKEGLK